MSDDTIKRSDAIKAVAEVLSLNRFASFKDIKDFGRFAERMLRNVPSADRPQGEWVPCTKGGLPLTELGRREGQKWYGYKCSKCNFIYKGNALTESPFCQNCGTNMKGVDDVV